ncbi:HlyC/CorC family transporter [Magnetospirillum sp. 64-120]|uniref:HlyC/CorC family transporter n=1 Tax=Magnetospirillum sp. 64-120 TaxID=1895778 RepID=UPI000AF5697D|nr:HlyC/CorC family transporter [Magnetospirillum sp. 64-120]
MDMTTLSLVIIFLLLLMSAFFSGSETALTAVSRPVMHQMEQDGSRRAKRVNRLIAARDRLIGSLLLGNNLVNILASSLATSAMMSLFGEAGIAYATAGMTVIVVMFGEVLPKTYAIYNANKVALTLSGPVMVLTKTLSPFVKAIELATRLFFKLFGARYATEASIESAMMELRGAIEVHATQDEVREERRMLRSILELGDVEVGEVMTHRKNMVTLDADLPPEDIVDQILGSPYTRIPLWRNDHDNIIGVVHAKDVLRAIRALGGEVNKLDVSELASKPWFIPDSTTLLEQLEAFKARREHFALVVDEYGALMGVVTLEDILEEIVGDIVDEHDISVAGVRPQTDGSFVVDGTVTIRDLNRQFEWRLPDDQATTIAGLLLHESRQIPTAGQVFRFHGFRFEVVRRHRNQITSIRLTPPQAESEEG